MECVLSFPCSTHAHTGVPGSVEQHVSRHGQTARHRHHRCRVSLSATQQNTNSRQAMHCVFLLDCASHSCKYRTCLLGRRDTLLLWSHYYHLTHCGLLSLISSIQAGRQRQTQVFILVLSTTIVCFVSPTASSCCAWKISPLRSAWTPTSVSRCGACRCRVCSTADGKQADCAIEYNQKAG